MSEKIFWTAISAMGVLIMYWQVQQDREFDKIHDRMIILGDFQKEAVSKYATAQAAQDERLISIDERLDKLEETSP